MSVIAHTAVEFACRIPPSSPVLLRNLFREFRIAPFSGKIELRGEFFNAWNKILFCCLDSTTRRKGRNKYERRETEGRRGKPQKAKRKKREEERKRQKTKKQDRKKDEKGSRKEGRMGGKKEAKKRKRYREKDGKKEGDEEG